MNKKAVKNSKTFKIKGAKNWFSKKKVVLNVWHFVWTVEQSLGNEWFARIKRKSTPYQRLLPFCKCYFSFQHMEIQIYRNISKWVTALAIFLVLQYILQL